MQTSKHGGPREGSGARKKAPEFVKHQITVGVEAYLIQNAGGFEHLQKWVKEAIKERFKNNGETTAPHKTVRSGGDRSKVVVVFATHPVTFEDWVTKNRVEGEKYFHASAEEDVKGFQFDRIVLTDDFILELVKRRNESRGPQRCKGLHR